MPLAVAPLSLPRWDEEAWEALVVGVFEDERPLRGAAGLADWRLCGRLSRLLEAGRATGAAGEALMLPPGRRLTARRLLWFGLGPSRGYDEARAAGDVRRIAGVVRDAGVTRWAFQVPGRATGQVGARRAAELVAAEPGVVAATVTLLEDAAGHREVSELLRGRR